MGCAEDRTVVAVITLGSASQCASDQARVLRQCAALRATAVIAVTAGTAGFLTALARPADRWMRTEVADVYGRPVDAMWLLRADGTAILDAAQLVTPHPYGADENLRQVATSYGIGQLVMRARHVGATQVVLSAQRFPGADAGSGALNGTGMRLLTVDGAGLKVGANELANFASIERLPVDALPCITVLCDTQATFNDVTEPNDPRRRFADVACTLNDRVTPDIPGSGTSDGLAFGLMLGLHATLADATQFGVTLHDPHRDCRTGTVLVGSAERVGQFRAVYGTDTQALVADEVTSALCDDVLAVVAQGH